MRSIRSVDRMTRNRHRMTPGLSLRPTVDPGEGGRGRLRVDGANRAPSGFTRRLGLMFTWAAALVALTLPTIAHTVFGVGVSPVLTSSMVPWVEPGDVVITKVAPAAEVRTGDVIAAVQPDSQTAFAHRIVDVASVSGLLRLTTKGDANPTADVDPVMLSTGAQVQKAVGHVRWVGYPLAFLSSTQGQQLALTLLVGANALALIVFATGRRTRMQSLSRAVDPLKP
jgi:signal peptidase I